MISKDPIKFDYLKIDKCIKSARLEIDTYTF